MPPLTRLAAAALFAHTSYAMCRVPILPLYAASLGAGPADIGLLMAMSTLTGVLLKAPAGVLSDAIGRGAVLVAAGVVFAVLPFTYLLAASLSVLMAVRALHGSATALFGPVASATVSDLAAPDGRGRALGLYSAVQGTGQASGAALAGSLALVSLPLVFIVSGVLGTAGLLLASAGRWPRVHGDAASRPGVLSGFRDVMRNPAILGVSGLQAGLMAVSGATSAFLPLFARDMLGLTPRAIGFVIAAQVAATLATRPVAGDISDRVGRTRIMQIGLLSVAAGIALVGTTNGWAQLLAGSVTFGAGVALAGAAASALVTDSSRRSGYGAAHGVFGTIYDIGDAAGPIIAGLVIALAGYRALFIGASVWTLLLALACLMRRSHAPVPRLGDQTTARS
jgi:MFS family permease